MPVVLRVDVFRDGDGENAKTLFLICRFEQVAHFLGRTGNPTGFDLHAGQCWLSTQECALLL